MATTKWLVALDDGTHAVEGIAPFEKVKNEITPWRKLLAHIAANGLEMTGLRLQVSRPGQPTFTINLPSRQRTPEGNHEKWITMRPVVPDSYTWQKWATFAPLSGEAQKHVEVRANFKNGNDVSVVVDEDEGNEFWVVVQE